jgi:hypothetical protein
MLSDIVLTENFIHQFQLNVTLLHSHRLVNVVSASNLNVVDFNEIRAE